MQQSIKRRLNNLKKISTELKSKILTENTLDQSSLSEILGSIIQTNFSKQQHSSIRESPTLTISVNSPDSLKKSQQSYAQSITVPFGNHNVQPSNSSPLQATELGKFSLASSRRSLAEHDFVHNEIEDYKQRNSELESQLGILMGEIVELKKIDNAKQEESWKENLPYMDKQCKIQAFVTKLYIKQYDFDKIDYESCLLQVQKDKIVIIIQNKPHKQFYLTNLNEVLYVNSNILRLEFKLQQMLYVYLHFDSENQRKEWDLALYVNYKIANDKEIDRSLFVQPKNIEKALAKESSKGKLTSKMEDSRVDKIRKGSVNIFEKKSDRSNLSKSSVIQSQKRSEESRSNRRQNNQLEYTLNGGPGFDGAISQVDNLEKDIKEFTVFNDFGHNQRGSKANTSRFNEKDEEIDLQYQEKERVRKLQEEENKRWSQIMKNLKEGFFFTKYSKDGIRPHDKRILLSEDETLLIFINNDNESVKKHIPIACIHKIAYPMLGEGVKKHIRYPVDENYCVIEYESQGETKIIELGCLRQIFIKKFYDEFREFLVKKGLLKQN